MKTPPAEELLSVAEASRLKGVSENGIRIAIRAERLAAEKRSFGYLIRKSDLLKWKPRKRNQNG